MDTVTILQRALPAIELAGALLLHKKGRPALQTLLFYSAFGQIAALAGYSLTIWAVPIKIALTVAAVLEIARLSRFHIPHVGLAITLIGTVSAFLAGIPRYYSNDSLVYLWRQNFYIGLFCGLAAIVVSRRLWPVKEQQAGIRAPMLVWMAVIAISGCFARGGIGFLLVRGSDPWRYVRVSESVGMWTYVSSLLAVCWLAIEAYHLRPALAIACRQSASRVQVVSRLAIVRRAA